MSDPQLFDTTPYEVPTLPTADELDGLGKDARATLRNKALITDQGINPGTRLPLHPAASRDRGGPGPRCGDCTHLYVKHAGNSRFLKCDQTNVRADVHHDGPDMRAWWPACTRYQPADGGAA